MSELVRVSRLVVLGVACFAGINGVLKYAEANYSRDLTTAGLVSNVRTASEATAEWMQILERQMTSAIRVIADVDFSSRDGALANATSQRTGAFERIVIHDRNGWVIQSTDADLPDGSRIDLPSGGLPDMGETMLSAAVDCPSCEPLGGMDVVHGMANGNIIVGRVGMGAVMPPSIGSTTDLRIMLYDHDGRPLNAMPNFQSSALLQGIVDLWRSNGAVETPVAPSSAQDDPGIYHPAVAGEGVRSILVIGYYPRASATALSWTGFMPTFVGSGVVLLLLVMGSALLVAALGRIGRRSSQTERERGAFLSIASSMGLSAGTIRDEDDRLVDGIDAASGFTPDGGRVAFLVDGLSSEGKDDLRAAISDVRGSGEKRRISSVIPSQIGEPTHLTLTLERIDEGVRVIALEDNDFETSRARADRDQRFDQYGALAGSVAPTLEGLIEIVSRNVETLSVEMDDGDALHPLIDNTLLAASRSRNISRKLASFGGNGRLLPSAIDVLAVVRGLGSTMKTVAGDDIFLGVELLSYGPFIVMADRMSLEETIVDVVSAAASSLPDKSGLIILTIGTKAIDEHGFGVSPGRYVEIAVMDNGRGMNDEEAEESVLPTAALGSHDLSSAYGFARQSGGRMDVESQPGSGTAVRILLPSSDGLIPEDMENSDLRAYSDTIVAFGVDPEFADRTRNLIRGLGYNLLFRSDERSLLALASEALPMDLLIVGTPPERTHADLLQRIERQHPDLAVLFTSREAARRWQDNYTGPKKVLASDASDVAFARAIRLLLDQQTELLG